jgi:hypothetical protein
VKEVCFPSAQKSQDDTFHYFYAYSQDELGFEAAYQRAFDLILEQIRARLPNFRTDVSVIKQYITYTQVSCTYTGRVQIFMEAKVPKRPQN